MVLLLLCALVVAEVALAALTVRSAADHPTARLVVRVVSIAVVVLLAGVGAVDWGPRYYALAGWLLVLVALAVVARYAGRRPGREVRIRRVVLRATGVVAGTVLATAPALVFPEYAPIEPTGEHGVASWVSTVTDPSRAETYADAGTPRTVTVQYWYPDVAGGPPEPGDQRFPLVVFSHGGMAVRSSNESLFGELASHGYVVASIDHTFHSLSVTDADGRTVWIDQGYLRDLRREDARSDPAGSLALYREWMAIRMGDIAFVIDHVRAQAVDAGLDSTYGLVDTERIGVVGHSLGGSAALGIGRTRDDVDVVVALESPFMADIRGVSGGEFVWEEAAYPVPVLNVYSDSSWGHLDEWPQYARNHELLTAGSADVVSVHVSGVGHLGLTDLALSSPLLTRVLGGQPTHDARGVLQTLNQHCLEFLDAHLEGTGASGESAARRG